MKLCDVPAPFDLDLGYRTLSVQAGKRYYTDEVAGAMPQYVVEEEPADDDKDGPQHARAKRS